MFENPPISFVNPHLSGALGSGKEYLVDQNYDITHVA